jgi:hypothetical protein
MKAVFKKNNEVLDFAVDEEIGDREQEFRDKYDDCKVESVTIDFKDGVVLKNIHNFNNVKPETVNEVIFNLR